MHTLQASLEAIHETFQETHERFVRPALPYVCTGNDRDCWLNGLGPCVRRSTSSSEAINRCLREVPGEDQESKRGHPTLPDRGSSASRIFSVATVAMEGVEE